MLLLGIQISPMMGMEDRTKKRLRSGRPVQQPQKYSRHEMMMVSWGVTRFLCGKHEMFLVLRSQPIVFYSVPLLLPKQELKWATFSLESASLIFLLLAMVFPEKIVFALGFNLINFYPWEGVARLILLLCLPLEIPRQLESLCGPPTHMLNPETPSGNACGKSLPSSPSFPSKWKCTSGSPFLRGCGVFFLLWG